VIGLFVIGAAAVLLCGNTRGFVPYDGKTDGAYCRYAKISGKRIGALRPL